MAMPRLLLALLLPTLASACSCIPKSPPCEAAWNASSVFLGTVVKLSRDARQQDSRGSTQINGFLGTHATIEVVEPFTGTTQRGKLVEVQTGMGGGDCGYPFQLGQSYVVYAKETKEEILVTSQCSRTAQAEKAQSDLKYLRTLGYRVPPAYIFGVVGNTAGFHYDEKLSAFVPGGISGVRVTITGGGKDVSLITGSEGYFQFDHLLPGKYRVSASKKTYRLEGGPREVQLHAGGCALVSENLVLDRR